MVGSLIVFLMIKQREENCEIQAQEKTKYFLHAFKSLVSKRIGFFLLASSFLIGGSMQLIYQFWQPFFFKYPDIDGSKQSLGLIFIAFMLTQYITSKLIRKYVLKNGTNGLFNGLMLGNSFPITFKHDSNGKLYFVYRKLLFVFWNDGSSFKFTHGSAW